MTPRFRRIPRDLSGFLTALFLVLTVAGCSAGERMKDLVKAKRYEEASSVYNGNPGYFAKNRGKFGGELATLRRVLISRYEPPLRPAHTNLSTLRWPAPVSQWPTVGQRLKGAKTALDNYARHHILMEPGQVSPHYTRLKPVYGGLEAGIRSSAPRHFARYNHLRNPKFFDLYPVPLEQQSFMAQNFLAIQSQLAQGTTAQLKRFLQFYPEKTVLQPAHYDALSNFYFDRAIGIDRNRASLAHYLTALSMTVRDGFSPRGDIGFQIAFIQVDPETDGRRSDFPVQLAVDLPAKILKSRQARALYGPEIENSDFIVVVEPRRVRARRKVLSVTPVASSYPDGYSREPNPEYRQVEFDLTKARSDMQYTATRLSSMPTLAEIDTLLAEARKKKNKADIDRLIRTREHRVRLESRMRLTRHRTDDAVSKLRSMPEFVDVPVEREYRYEIVKLRARKVARIIYYIIDKKTRRYTRAERRFGAEETFTVIEKLHRNDPNAEAILTQHDQGESMSEWRRAPLEIRMSEITSRYSEELKRAKGFKNLETVRKALFTGN